MMTSLILTFYKVNNCLLNHNLVSNCDWVGSDNINYLESVPSLQNSNICVIYKLHITSHKAQYNIVLLTHILIYLWVLKTTDIRVLAKVLQKQVIRQGCGLETVVLVTRPKIMVLVLYNVQLGLCLEVYGLGLTLLVLSLVYSWSWVWFIPF